MTSVDRRGFLHRVGAVVGGATAGSLAAVSEAAGAQSAAVQPATDDGMDLNAVEPFIGVHQSGILNPKPSHATLVALDSFAPDAQTLAQALHSLSLRAGQLTQGGAVPLPPSGETPAADSGILGPFNAPDALTVTIAFGASLFDGRYGLSPLRPRELIRMPTFSVDQLDPAQAHGDLLLQICAQHRDTVVHTVRELLRVVRGTLQQRWSIDGFTSAQRGPTPRSHTRNLFAFRDGTANPPTSDAALMNRLVWAGAGEPAWARGGTYQVVRIIRMHVEFWDRVGVTEQQNMIGRERDSGAPIGMTSEFADPQYDLDPTGRRIPLNAHIRLANPRTPPTADQRFLRRGFNYERGFDAAGQLDEGLVFIAFNQSPHRQFATVQRRLDGEPMTDYVTPVGGGYFFAPPGARANGDFVGSGLFS